MFWKMIPVRSALDVPPEPARRVLQPVPGLGATSVPEMPREFVPKSIPPMAPHTQIVNHDEIETPGPMPMTKTVLIVEDNELNMKLFHDLLDAHGYRTLQTRNGVEALELAREHRPDLILMDIQLPEVSGLDVTKWLKSDDELCEIPVVAVTAFAMKGDEERIREGGCEAYISKPISVMMFLDTVREFIGEAQ